MSRRELFCIPGVRLAEVRCGGGEDGWSPEELVTGFGVVLVRSGLFRRRVDGTELVAEPGMAYVQHAGSIQRVAHPVGGDVCTVVALSRAMLGPLLAAARSLPNAPLFTSPAVDVAHRVLVARARQGADELELAERAAVLAGGLLEPLTLGPPPSVATPHSRRVVDQVRQALAQNSDLRLSELARVAGVSVYHLSRAFRSVTGFTLSRYRIRLRARSALEMMAAGERDLARLALDVGFADQAHLTRSLRGETGMTPGRLRALLTGARAS